MTNLPDVIAIFLALFFPLKQENWKNTEAQVSE